MSTGTPHALYQFIQIWVAAACTLGVLSVLYRENKMFRVCEHLFVGLSLGFWIFQGWRDVLKPQWWTPMVYHHEWYRIFALVYAAMFFTVYIPRFAWISRLAIGISFGLAAGNAFQGFAGQTMPQIAASFKPLWGHASAGHLIDNWIFVLTLACVMMYFFFSFEQKNAVVKGSAGIGRWLLMIAFGATFGNTVMARFSLFIDRMDFLIHQWAPTFVQIAHLIVR